MKASLDTNVIIHFYRAGLQNILFDSFNDGIIIFEQIRYVELENHGQDILTEVDKDIERGKIQLITSSQLKDLHVYKIFEHHVKENKLLYSAGDLGEVYAISLAQTLGTYSLITDDIKPGGPYTSLLQLNYDVMPFNFADILIIRYLSGTIEGRIEAILASILPFKVLLYFPLTIKHCCGCSCHIYYIFFSIPFYEKISA